MRNNRLLIAVMVGAIVLAGTAAFVLDRMPLSHPAGPPDAGAVPIVTDVGAVAAAQRESGYTLIPVRASGVSVATESCMRCLAKYPTSLLRRVVRKVVLVESLSYLGEQPLGVYIHPGLFVIRVPVLVNAATMAELNKTIDHELCTAIVRGSGVQFPVDDWLAANGGPYDAALKSLATMSDSSRNRLPALQREGFVNVYAATSMSNDLSEAAALLMNDGGTLVALAIEHERIRAKACLLADYYNGLGVALSPEWTAYARSLAR